jgi:hypothetical protein
MITSGVQRSVELGQRRTLHLLALGSVLLDEIGAGQRCLEFGMKRQPALGHFIGKRLRGAEPNQCRP